MVAVPAADANASTGMTLLPVATLDTSLYQNQKLENQQ
jgi:hypothetical protein